MHILRWTLVLFLMSVGLARAEDGGRYILVLDASGSMWGQIDGKAKIDIAKSVVAKVVGSWKPADELGLVAYGHREKGSCSDIEVLREPSSLDAGGYMKSVKALSPKGKTPMTQAVRMAAEALKFTEKKATVILVSDGIETCDADPCAVAEELEKLGVGLTVHTVGFGLDNKDAAPQLRCLAEKTGGISIIADNADQLEKALKETVKAEAAPPPQPAAPEFNFLGRVMMAEGVELPEPFNVPSWTFAQAADGAYARTEYGNALKVNIDKPGDYHVKISVDSAAIDVPIKIEAGKATDPVFSLEAGIINLSATTDGAMALADDGAAWELLRDDGSYVTTKYGPTPQFLANAGAYKVRLALGVAKVEQDVVIAAGKITDVKLSLGVGIIEASAVFAAGGDKVGEGAAIELREGKAALDGDHKWINTQYGAPSLFMVPAGDYVIAVAKDFARGESQVSVKAGQAAKIDVVLNAGYLAVSAPGASTIEVFSGEKDISGNRKWLATEYTDRLNRAFNAGAFHVIAKAPDGTLVGEKDAEVKAGARTEIALP